MLRNIFKNFYILRYLRKFFTIICKEYIRMYFVLVNYKNTKSFFYKNKENFQIIKKYISKSKQEHFRKIVFIIDGVLQKTGGVEIRLLKTLNFLESQGFLPVIVATQNDCEQLFKYPLIKFSFENILSLKIFVKFIKKIHPEYVEFQIKSPSPKILPYICNPQIKALKTITKMGILFHSQQYFLLEKQIKHFDNILSVGTDWLKRFKNLQYKIYKIPNYILPQKNTWLYSGQTTVLFVSRLEGKDKTQHICNLILLCKEYNFNIDVAGIGKQSFIENAKKFAKNNNVTVNFIGEINTLEYLNKNLNKILFVAGVGQVIFEATSFNIPALVISHHKNPDSSNFVTKDNVQKITAYNCVLNKLKLSGQGVKEFVTDIPNNLEKYKVKDYIEKNYSIEKIMNIYMNVCNLK